MPKTILYPSSKRRNIVSWGATLCDPMDCSPPGSFVHGILQARILEWVSLSLLRGNLPNTGIQPRSPTLQADSLPAEPQGKPKNTGVGSLSLLQRIFLTQESNLGLLHCRQIFYCLSHHGLTSDGQTISHWKWTPSNHLPNGPSL